MFIVWGKITSQRRRNTQASPSKPILFDKYHSKLFFGEGILNFCSEYFRPYHDVQSGYNDVLQLNFPVQRNLNEGLYK